MRLRGRTSVFLAATAVLSAVGLAAAQPATGPVTAPPQEPAPAEAVAPATPAPLAPSGAPAAAAPLASDSATAEEEPSGSGGPAKPAPPPRRALYTAAVIQVLDKVTAENLKFEAPLHKFIRYKGLLFLVLTCQGGTPDQPTPAAYVEVDSQAPSAPGRPPNPVKLVYKGWMYADTPGPHPFEHPVYDVWLTACKTASGGA